jgi:2-phospho-L-lactate guanylyltransferase
MNEINAIIPVASLDKAKSRLKSVLTSSQRAEMVLYMLDDVSSVLLSSVNVQSVTVISPDSKVIEHASKFGLETILEPRPRGLNAALNLATRTLVMKSPRSSSLILPVDIPLLQISSLAALFELMNSSSEPVVIATKSNNGGTNLLLRYPGDVIDLAFGENSYALHRQNALLKNIQFKEWVSQDTTLDIDTPEDLLEFMKLGKSAKTWCFLESIESLK